MWNETGRDVTISSKYQMMCGMIHRTLKNKTRKDTRIKFYKTIAVPEYGCITWAPTNSKFRHELFEKNKGLYKPRPFAQ